jgi:hypothetical protein
MEEVLPTTDDDAVFSKRYLDGRWIEVVSSEECVVVTCQNRKVELSGKVNGPLDIRRSSGERREFSMGEVPDYQSVPK